MTDEEIRKVEELVNAKIRENRPLDEHRNMKTATCPNGRDVSMEGYPLKISEMLALLDGTCYVTRQAVHTAAATVRAKKSIRKALENSMNSKGTSIVEIVSTCNSGWKMTPHESTGSA